MIIVNFLKYLMLFVVGNVFVRSYSHPPRIPVNDNSSQQALVNPLEQGSPTYLQNLTQALIYEILEYHKNPLVFDCNDFFNTILLDKIFNPTYHIWEGKYQHKNTKQEFFFEIRANPEPQIHLYKG